MIGPYKSEDVKDTMRAINTTISLLQTSGVEDGCIEGCLLAIVSLRHRARDDRESFEALLSGCLSTPWPER